MPVTYVDSGATSDYSGAGVRPTGGSVTGAKTIVLVVTHFYDPTSNASVGGFTSRARRDDGNSVVVTILSKYAVDVTLEPTSYTPTISGGGNDARTKVIILDGVDPITPVPPGGTSSASVDSPGTLSISGAAVTVDDSLAILGCSDWDFGVWASNNPAGWTQLNDSSTELGCYYAPNQDIGTSVGATFGTQDRSSIALVVFQPTSGGGGGLGSFFDQPPPPKSSLSASRPFNVPWALSAIVATATASFGFTSDPPRRATVPTNSPVHQAVPPALSTSPSLRPWNYQEPALRRVFASRRPVNEPWTLSRIVPFVDAPAASPRPVVSSPLPAASPVFPALGFAPSPQFLEWSVSPARGGVPSHGASTVVEVPPLLSVVVPSTWIPTTESLSRRPAATSSGFNSGVLHPRLTPSPNFNAWTSEAPRPSTAPHSVDFASPVFPLLAVAPAPSSSFTAWAPSLARGQSHTQSSPPSDVFAALGFAPSPSFVPTGEAAIGARVLPSRPESVTPLSRFIAPALGSFFQSIASLTSTVSKTSPSFSSDVFPALSASPAALLPFVPSSVPAVASPLVSKPLVSSQGLPPWRSALSWVSPSVSAPSRSRTKPHSSSEFLLPALESRWIAPSFPATSRWVSSPRTEIVSVLPPLTVSSGWLPESLSSFSRILPKSNLVPSPVFAPYVAPELTFFNFAPPPSRSLFIPAQSLAASVTFLPTVLPPPDARSIRVPLMPSTTQFFPTKFFRRVEALRHMVVGASSTPLIYTGPNGRLILTPLLYRDARTEALLRLREFLSLVTFRREAGPGEEQGIPFRLPLAQIHEEMPDDILELQPPAIGFLPVPGPGIHESLGLSGLEILDETQDVFGPGTVVVRYGDWIENLTLEVFAEKKAHRRGLVAGLQQVLRLGEESGTLRLKVPALFGAVADFNLTDTLYIDDPYVVQNRRRAHLHVTLTVPEVFLARSYPVLRTQLSIQVDTAVVETSSVLQQLDPTLSPDLVALLIKKP